MAIYDNNRLVIKVCHMFYEKNLSQKEISLQLGISKSQICRMLNYAKEKGIVKFIITNPYAQEFEYEKRLIEKYGLSEAYVFNFKYEDEQEMYDKLGKCCSEQLDKYLSPHSKTGIMSGRIIASAAKHMHRLNKEDLEFIPLSGNMGNKGYAWNANTIVQNFSINTGGSCCILNAPILLKNSNAKQIICSEPSIKEVLDKMTKCSTYIVGIGEISASSTACQSGAYAPSDVNTLLLEGAYVSVGVSYISENGNIIKSSLDNRSVGLSLLDINKPNCCKTQNVIAIAAGNCKLKAANAALKSKKINIFMTTLDFAKDLCSI